MRFVSFIFCIVSICSALCAFSAEKASFDSVKAKAENGDAWAQYDMGTRYNFGKGVPVDMREAVKWYKMAAGNGIPEAQFNLGCCYENGTGIEKNHTEAFKWCKTAAESGLPAAQYNLGVYYREGIGTQKTKKNPWSFWKSRQKTVFQRHNTLSESITSEAYMWRKIRKRLWRGIRLPQIKAIRWRNIILPVAITTATE